MRSIDVSHVGAPCQSRCFDLFAAFHSTPRRDNCALDALAEACATRSRWTFLLAVAPLVLVRGTASPVNPLAIF